MAKFQHIYRQISPKILSLVEDNPVIFLMGPPYIGKTHLTRDFEQQGYKNVSFLCHVARAQAKYDPNAFLDELGDKVILDEFHKVPKLLDYIPKVINGSQINKSFLLIDNYYPVSKLKDYKNISTTFELRNIAQSEFKNKKSTFLNCIFNDGLKPKLIQEITDQQIFNKFIKGSFPLDFNNDEEYFRSWYQDYIHDSIARSYAYYNISIEFGLLKKSIEVLAYKTSKLLDVKTIGSIYPFTKTRFPKYLEYAKQTYFVKELPAFDGKKNQSTNLPRVYISDTGVLCSLLGISKIEGNAKNLVIKIKNIYKNFLYQELVKLCSLDLDDKYQLSHFLYKDQIKVDFIVSNERNKHVAIEIKNKQFVCENDFQNINKFKTFVGTRNFANGVVIYNGNYLKFFGNKNWAVPINLLWDLDTKEMKFFD